MLADTRSPDLAPADVPLDVETVIVGAGISGIGTAIELQREGMGSYVILEKAHDLGGTWRQNTYPGIAVDIPSISYSFSYEIDFPWSRVFAPGTEIHQYVHAVAEKYGVKPHIRYGAEVRRTVFDEETHTWTTHLAGGDVLRSRYLVACTGFLSVPKRPDIEGLERFEGTTMHTAEWDHDVPLAGRRVGIIGTGASAVQVVPSIAPEVGHLEVFQRTPIWVGPRRDAPIPRRGRLDPRSTRAFRRLRRYATETFLELGTYLTVNYARSKNLVKRVEAAQAAYIRRSVKDPALHEKLVPKYGFGCKRPALSNDYLQSFNRDNVDLVTESIECIRPEGILTSDGVLHAVDVLILATGFRTLEPGNAPSFDVHGLGGVELGKWWYENRYQAYGGVSVPGFPNFFLTAGPYSGGFNWFAMLEPHVKYILRCMKHARARKATWVEARQEAHDRYMADMRKRSRNAVFTDAACVAAHSYYLDHHGDASLPFPRTPWWRWFRVRFSSMDSFRFEPGPQTGRPA